MWFKGGLHIHSNAVDGKLSKVELIDLYRKNDFDFISITDHNIFSHSVNKLMKDFLVIEDSMEFNIQDSIMHMLGVGLDKKASQHFDAKKCSYQEMLDFFYNNGALTIICHPNWRWVSSSFKELGIIKNFHGMEICNIVLDDDTGNTFAFDKWDYLLSCGYKIWGYAVDDYHDPLKDKPGRGFVMAKAENLDRTSILDALKNGNFYSSTGLILDELNIEGSSVDIYSKDCKEIVLFGLNGRYLDSFDKNSISLKTDRYRGYVRCELRSEKGSAFLQPFFNNEQVP